MTKQELIELLKYIVVAYPRFEIVEDTPKIWHDFLKDESYDVVLERLKTHIRESKYMPSISELLEHPEKTERRKTVEELMIERGVTYEPRFKSV